MNPRHYFHTGDTSPAIATTKSHLSRLGYTVADTSPLFDHQFEYIVRAFQQDRGLATDGIIGPETLYQVEFARHRLGDRVLRFDPTRPLQGDDVADLQKRLAKLGIYTDRIDYTFGPLTHAAVCEMQADMGLNPDGIVGPATVKVLHNVNRDSNGGNVHALRERGKLTASGQSVAGRVIVIESSTFAQDFSLLPFTPQQQALAARYSNDIAHRIEGRLTALGAAAVHAQEHDPEFADKLGAAAIITINQDVDPSPRPNGVATFYYGKSKNSPDVSPIGQQLAALVQREIVARTDFQDCRSHAQTWQSLRTTTAPRIHALVGYISNEHDRSLLDRATTRDAIAEAVVVGVQRLFLFAENDHDTGTLDLRQLGDLAPAQRS